ncbi:Zn-dependent alcohol dehydrogenase [Amycolatopsis sp. GM8]|uniref:Zn-dependent alcohol dehydrogenase n=1 Tax=Amycolatopsis sp. GM8 TaxID=2896530 RepID=UPI001F2912E7|nr:Zn-dependent alcohol dehydrogenase [Amycolatopsis sp. GM8]
MKTRAAIAYETNQEWSLDKQLWKVEELELAPLGPQDVLVRLPATGVCHTDLHIITGELAPTGFPIIGGHEGAGVVEEVGREVTHVEPGDHVILSIVASCGACRFCRRGKATLCVRSIDALSGLHRDGRPRYRTAQGQDVGQWSLLGTFSEYVVASAEAAIKIDPGIPLDNASIVGCAVTTGLGAAIDKAGVRSGDTVAVWGCGGVGLSAVQGALIAGASEVVAIDTNDLKLAKAKELGATLTLNPHRDRTPNPYRDETAEKVMEYTEWVGADSTILTVDYVTPELVGAAFGTIRNGGILVVVGVSHPSHDHVKVSPLELAMSEKGVVGSVYGSGTPTLDLPRNLHFYTRGQLHLDEMITRTYPLEQVNNAFDDLLNGTVVKTLLTF